MLIIKKYILITALLSFVFLLTACKKNTVQPVYDPSKLSVSVTFNALAEFAAAVGQDKVQISTIIPAGMEPHDFEPKAADIAQLTKTDVFIYNGLGMESWAEDTAASAQNKDLVVINASKNITPLDNNNSNDPHLWLGIKGAQLEVQNIADGLVAADPANKDFYEANAAAYIKELEEIYLEYQPKFKALSNKNFVTGHAAFGYFCQDFGLAQNSVEDVFAEGEPSSKQLAQLVDYCKEYEVTTIFAEDMASPQISQTLADEVGASVETIHTMESAEDSLSYLDRMKDNCNKIYNSLVEK